MHDIDNFRINDTGCKVTVLTKKSLVLSLIFTSYYIMSKILHAMRFARRGDRFFDNLKPTSSKTIAC